MSYRPRLFAGIELDDRVRKRCAEVAARLQAQGVPARLERTEKLHVTLAFLGWVNPELVADVQRVLADVARDCAPFTLTLDKVSAFPHECRPSVVWIGSREQGAAFRVLAGRIRDAYRELGFAFDKAAVAHVTIARIKGGSAHLPMLEMPPAQLRVHTLTLFESLPSAGTTRYEVRQRTALQGPAP